MQPHSKLGFVVVTILGLRLGLSVGALVDIVLGIGTSDKALLEEAAVGAQLGCSVNAVRGTTIARNKARPGRLVVGTILGLRLELFFAGALVGIVLDTADGALLGCSVDATTLKARTRRGYDTRSETGTL